MNKIIIRLDNLDIDAVGGEIPELTEECLLFDGDGSEKVGKCWEIKYVSPYEDIDGNLIVG